MARRRCAAYVAVCLALSVVGGCGNANSTKVIGQTALRQTPFGEVVAVVKVCSDSVNAIDVSGSREGLADSATNPSLGSFTTSKTQGGTFEVNLTKPTTPWTAKSPLGEPTAPTKSWVIAAHSTDKNAETTQVTATPEQVRELGGDDVVINAGQVVTRATFEAKACEGS